MVPGWEELFSPGAGGPPVHGCWGPRMAGPFAGLGVVCLLTSITEKTALCARGLLSSERLPREEALTHLSPNHENAFDPRPIDPRSWS